MITLKVKRLTESAKLPTRAHEYDAGLDLYADEEVFVPLGATRKIKTGIAVDIAKGYYGQIHDRSSMGSKGLRTGAGVIDTGYQGELSIIIHNISYNDTLNPSTLMGYKIKKGDKIAQLVIHSIELPIPIEVASFEESDRGTKGFGSSGV